MKIREHKIDLILICSAIIIGVIISLIYFTSQRAGDLVIVKLDNRIIRTYSLNVDMTEIIEVDGQAYNTITISDGVVYVSDANCPDKLCMNKGQISSIGQSIVCLPHKLVVTVEGDKDSEIDAISK